MDLVCGLPCPWCVESFPFPPSRSWIDDVCTDQPTTEKLDYFSAALVFIVALYTVVSRYFFLGRPSRRTVYKLWAFLCTVVFISHVSYLSFLPRFDYTYNIIFNLVIGLLHNFLWLLYALPESYTIIRRFPPSPAPDRKSTRLNSSHSGESRMPSSA